MSDKAGKWMEVSGRGLVIEVGGEVVCWEGGEQGLTLTARHLSCGLCGVILSSCRQYSRAPDRVRLNTGIHNPCLELQVYITGSSRADCFTCNIQPRHWPKLDVLLHETWVNIDLVIYIPVLQFWTVYWNNTSWFHTRNALWAVNQNPTLHPNAIVID